MYMYYYIIDQYIKYKFLLIGRLMLSLGYFLTIVRNRQKFTLIKHIYFDPSNNDNFVTFDLQRAG